MISKNWLLMPNHRFDAVLAIRPAPDRRRPQRSSQRSPQKANKETSVMRMRILNANLELAVADLLVMIEAIVSGYGGGDGDGQKVVGPALEAEHLETDEKSAERAVGDAAE